MARIRSIKPDFWESEDTSTLPIASALVYAGLWNYSDDEGRGRFQPSILHARLMALRPDGSMNKTRAALEVLLARKLVVVYEAEGLGALYYIPSFKKHQHPDKPQPSKYPNPPRLLPDQSPTTPLPVGFENPPGEEGREERKGIRRGERGAEGSPPPLFAARDEDAEVLETVSRFAAWSHPVPDKKADGIRELRSLGCSHEYIRNGAQVNKPADAGFWDIVRALKAARNSTRRATVPGAHQRENATAYEKSARPNHEEIVAEQKRKDEAIAKCRELLLAMDPTERERWFAEARAAAEAAKVFPTAINAYVESQLLSRIAKQHGVEGL